MKIPDVFKNKDKKWFHDLIMNQR